MKDEHAKDSDNEHVYELGYHILPTVEEIDLQSQVTKIHSLISENGGSVIAESAPTMRQLAYEIVKKVETKSTKFSKAYFGWVKFEIDRAEIINLDNKLKNNPSILRFLIIKTVKENTMYTPKAPVYKREKNKEEGGEKHDENPEVSEALIDKSIDELLVN